MKDQINGLYNGVWFKNTDPTKRERSCWISPEGEWYNCRFSEHVEFAVAVLHDENKDYIREDGDKNPSDILVKKGWIFVHHDPFIGTIVNGWKRMTRKQYKILSDFFKDEMLFRGWTIRLLYQESKKE